MVGALAPVGVIMLFDSLLEADEEVKAREKVKAWHARTAAAALALVGLACVSALLALGPGPIGARPARLPTSLTFRDWEPPQSVKRCDWIVDRMVARQNPADSYDDLKEMYATQSKDANTFYRATAHLFWEDFVRGGWGHFDFSSDLGIATTLADGSPIVRTSAWTWVTGDQHLSNFGAWKNRNKDVVFGVNDFDEAVGYDCPEGRWPRPANPSTHPPADLSAPPQVIYDFQMDVWRVAVSVVKNVVNNGR